MNDRDWTKVADMQDLEVGTPYSFNVAGAEVLVLRTESDDISAVANECPHYGAPLSDGFISGTTLTCPWHNARFDLPSGDLLGPPALDCLATYETKVQDGALLLKPNEKPAIHMPGGTDSRRVLIIGGGAGGNACAETLRREGFAGQITVLSADPDRPYDRPMLSKGFVSGLAEESWLPLRPSQFYDDLSIDILNGRKVVDFDPATLVARCDTGDTYQADRVVLATGARPRRLSIPGWDLDGVYTLRSAEDARAIRSIASEDASVAIIGAGFIGMELAADLRARGLSVHVIAPEEEPMSLMFGNEVGAYIRTLHGDAGVEFHMGTKPKEILGERRCREVRLFDDSSVQADFVVAGLGVEPVVEFLGESGLATDGAVPVDETLETEAGGVYAIGDIALTPYPHRDDPYRIEHWVVAEAQGMHAARAILGHTDAYAKIPFFWTRQHETSIKYIGYPAPSTKTEIRGSVAEGDALVGYFRGDRLLGATSLGRTQELLAVERMLSSGAEIAADEFARADLG